MAAVIFSAVHMIDLQHATYPQLSPFYDIAMPYILLNSAFYTFPCPGFNPPALDPPTIQQRINFDSKPFDKQKCLKHRSYKCNGMQKPPEVHVA